MGRADTKGVLQVSKWSFRGGLLLKLRHLEIESVLKRYLGEIMRRFPNFVVFVIPFATEIK